MKNKDEERQKVLEDMANMDEQSIRLTMLLKMDELNANLEKMSEMMGHLCQQVENVRHAILS